MVGEGRLGKMSRLVLYSLDSRLRSIYKAVFSVASASHTVSQLLQNQDLFVFSPGSAVVPKQERTF